MKKIFNSTLQRFSRKVEFGAISPSDNPFDEPMDFEAYASLKTFTGGWVVQIYIVDSDGVRTVNLLPVGSSGIGRAVGGLKNTYSRSAGREKCVAVLDGLRAADPTLTTG
ncbi:MAG: hypothetical protein ACRDP6_39590 [Actinoallomurus sp.]